METNDLLREILKWQKIQGLAIMRSLIPTLLDSKAKKAVYDLTDGTLAVKEISKKTGVATGTVSNWWKKWFSEGILSREGDRYIKIVSLKDLLVEEKKENEREANKRNHR